MPRPVQNCKARGRYWTGATDSVSMFKNFFGENLDFFKIKKFKIVFF